MATSFPTSLQDLDATRGTNNDPLSAPNHVTHHALEDDTIEALEAKVGIDNSADTNSLDYKLKSTSSSNPGHKHTLANGATDITATPTELNYVGGVTSAIQTQLNTKQTRSVLTTKGDFYVATASDTVTRMPAGTNGYLLSSNSAVANGLEWVASTTKFGGTGADGALAVSSGTTSIDLGSAKYVVKNYTSISITGTGAVNFTNPHATGSFVVLRSQGAVTLTSSATPMLDGRSIGAPGAAAVSGTADQVGVAGTNGVIGTLTSNAGAASATVSTAAVGGAAPTAYTVGQLIANAIDSVFLRYWNHMFVGAGASSGCIQTNVGGTHTSGTGGRGGGALVIECGGAWNFTTANGISVAGVAGGAATCDTREAGGGGGGAGGSFLALYNTLTANSGTVNVAGGTGGAGCGTFFATTSGGAGGGSDQAGSNGITANPHTGGAGAAGRSLITANTLFV